MSKRYMILSSPLFVPKYLYGMFWDIDKNIVEVISLDNADLILIDEDLWLANQ